MRSSRWQAQGNVYLVTDDGPLTRRARRGPRSATPTASSRCSRPGDDWLEIAIWNPDGSLGRDVGKRHADRRALARRADAAPST